MRTAIFMLLSSALVSCGGSSKHNPDAAVDTPPDTLPVTATLTLTTYTASGPVNTQLVAVQDGDGPWAVVSGNAGVYTAMLHGDRFGVTVACSTTMFSSVFTIYAAVSDGTNWYVGDCSDPGPAAATISGSVTGAAAANPVRVMNGFDFVDVPAGMTTYSLPTTAGPAKLFAEELVNKRPIKLAAVDATVIDGATVNFNLAAGFAPVTHSLVSSAPLTSASLSYRDIHGIDFLDRSAAPVTDFRAVPAAQLGMGLNRLSASASATASGSQFVIRYFKNPADQSITMPPVLQLPQQPTATATPYPTATAKLPVAAGVTLYDFDFSTTNQTTMASRDFFAEMTAAYVAKAFPGGTISFTMPDFHSLPGWQTGFQLEAALPIDFFIETSANVNVDLFNTLPPDQFAFHDGGEEKFTSALGQLPAP